MSKKIVNQFAEATNKQAKELGLASQAIKPLSMEKGKDIDAIKDRVTEIEKMVKQLVDAKSGKKEVQVKTSFNAQE